jgi:hypothetical protein
VSDTGYFFSAGHWVTVPNGVETVWDSPVSFHDSREAAFDAGWKYHDHDDFVLGLVRNDELLWLGSVEKTFPTTPGEYGEHYEEIAEQNGWTVSPKAPTEVTS